MSKPPISSLAVCGARRLTKKVRVRRKPLAKFIATNPQITPNSADQSRSVSENGALPPKANNGVVPMKATSTA